MPPLGWAVLRVCSLHLFVIATIAVLAALALASAPSEGVRIYVEDDFNATYGSPPDVDKWEVDLSDENNSVTVQGQHLVTSSVKGRCYFEMVDEFSCNNFTVTFDVLRKTIEGTNFMVGVWTDSPTQGGDWLSFANHDGRWEATYMAWGSWRTYYGDFYDRESRTDIWFSAKLVVREDEAYFRVWERASGLEVWKSDTLRFDPLLGRNHVKFGVVRYGPNEDSLTHWDNILVYTDPSQEQTPRWVNVPTLEAVEDQMFSYNFKPHISDDQRSWELALSSWSEYVASIQGLTVDFLFPNNVTRTTVTLTVDDGLNNASKLVTFNVTPVNDPPDVIPPPPFTVFEGIPYHVHLGPFIWDIDSPRSSLTLVEDSPYAAVGPDLVLTVTFPEGFVAYDMMVGISDGEFVVPLNLSFFIQQTNNPPVLSRIANHVVTEDVHSILDISEYVSDPDDPLSRLDVTVSSPWCTVDGMLLTFLYKMGGWDELVQVIVSDGEGNCSGTFTVQVMEVNDPPVVDDPPTVHVTEDEATDVNLAEWVRDEETPDDELQLSCEHPNLMRVEGLTLTLLYTINNGQFRIWFNVSDGPHTTEGSIIIMVDWVNDDPRITEVGGHGVTTSGPFTASIELTVPSGIPGRFNISAEDEDDTALTFNVDANWGIIRMDGDQLYIKYVGPDIIGWLMASLYVSDPRGGTHMVPLRVQVISWRDSGLRVNIHAQDDSVREAGLEFTLEVDVHDPNGYLGDDLTTMWSSHRSGELLTTSWEEDKKYHLPGLPEGRHMISVEITDGEVTLSDSVWFEMTASIDEDTNGGGSEDPCLTWLPVIILTVVALSVIWFFASAISEGSDRSKEKRARRAEKRIVKALGANQLVREEMFHASQGTIEETRREEATAPPPPAGQQQAVLRALEALPGGLPSDLSLYDLPTIAERVVKGRQRTSPDGRLLAFVQGHWYYADPGDVEFMRPFEEG